MIITDLLWLGCSLLYILLRKFRSPGNGTRIGNYRFVFFLLGSCYFYGRVLHLIFQENFTPVFALLLCTGIPVIVFLTIFYSKQI
jgi:hypothetical protein